MTLPAVLARLITRRTDTPAEPTDGWEPIELHGLVEDQAAEAHGPTPAELEAHAWALIADMDRQHAEAQWWHSWESQAGGYAADLAVMPVLLDGLPDAPRPKPRRRPKAGAM